jgi:hypothetical protein
MRVTIFKLAIKKVILVSVKREAILENDQQGYDSENAGSNYIKTKVERRLRCSSLY